MCAGELAYPYTMLFQGCLRYEELPETRKFANNTPIHKKKTEIQGYKLQSRFIAFHNVQSNWICCGIAINNFS